MTGRFTRIKREVSLTERDYQAVRHVYFARYLTNRQVCRLLYTPTTFSYCKQRIRYLYDLGWLKKRATQPHEMDIYYLGLKGRRWLEAQGSADASQVAGVRGEGGLMMSHDLTLSTLYVNAVLEARQFGWTLVWKSGRTLELEKLGVQPDAYVRVQGPKGVKEAYIEFTGVLPTADELAKRLWAYGSLYERLKKGIPLLWLTTSRSKLERLKRGLAGYTYQDYVLLGLIEDASAFLTKTMWWWCKSTEMIGWIKPGERVVYQA